MFGYVRPYRPSVTLADYEFYRAVYCGLCRAMKHGTGKVSSLALNYDMVFLALVRLLIGERQISIHPHRCAVHPLKPCAMVVDNPATDYAARVTVLLSYYKMADDLKDHRFLGRVPPAAAMAMLRRGRKRAGLAPLGQVIERELSALSRMEQEKTPSIDLPAAAFGRLLGAVFSYDAPDACRDALYAMGDALGRFIYCADAAEDFARDEKNGAYNPYVLTYGATLSDGARQDIHTALLCILAEGEPAWQSLPFEGAGAAGRLTRNILYEGLPHRIDFLLSPPPRGKHRLTPYDGPLP